MAARSLKTLCEGLIDYAGLFPPAKLPMPETLENYARYTRQDEAWMLGRLICPASRLQELTQHGRALMPGTWATSGYREHADDLEPWRISAIIDMPLAAAIEAILAFNRNHASEEQGTAGVDVIELKAPGAGEIDDVIDEVPEQIYPWFEIPADGDLRGIIAALAGSEAGAKIRCGGVTADLIPPAARVAQVIAACDAARVPLKATAGLHHPVRAEHALTYEDAPPRAVMHGFVNLFLGGCLLAAGEVDEAGLVEVLEETDAGAFAFDDDGAAWRDRRVSTGRIAEIRGGFLAGFGSCSFEEPVGDLKGLGWL